MNFVGKILVFLIFLLSVVFMTGTFMVFATQKNWRDVVEAPGTGLKTQVADRQADITELNRQITELQQQYARQLAEKEQWLAASEARADRFAQQNEQLQADMGKYEEAQRKAVADVDGLTQRLAANDAELEQVRTTLDETRRERNQFMNQVSALNDAVAQANRALEQFEERNGQLATDLAAHRKALADNDIQLDSSIKVEGVITAIDSQNFVELSIGSDDGLQPGKVLDVYRYAQAGGGEPKWLGQVEVIRTNSDKAVAKFLPKTSQAGRIQVGDLVATLVAP